MNIERDQTFHEELANSITHGIFLFIIIIFTHSLLKKSLESGSNLVFASNIFFCSSVIIVYFVSTLYHAVNKGPLKKLLRIVDHGAIYLLIVGTYTPFSLIIIEGRIGWTLFFIELLLASIGITFLIFTGLKYKTLSLILYMLMGWLIIIALKSLYINLPGLGLILVFTGGLAYTIGIYFYRLSYLKFRHFIWHLFVVLGTSFHFIAVYLYST